MAVLKKKGIKSWIKAIIIAIIIVVFFNLFVFESVVQKNDSMEGTLYEGDFVLINKLSFGPRLPIVFLKIPFTDLYSELITLPYLRIPGFSKIKHNDLLAFNYPYQSDIPIDKKKIYVKRCFGLPGDTIEIIDKVIYSNQILIDTLDCLKHKYRFTAIKFPLSDFFFKRYNITDHEIISSVGLYEANIELRNVTLMEKDSSIKNLRIMKELRADKCENTYPQSSYIKWNNDYFGPFVIPKENDTLKLNEYNIDIYKRLISAFEKNNLIIKDKKIYINDIETKTYIVKNNYYFVLDDNRDKAKDSRNWGLLPENHIIGKPSFIWFSVSNKNNIRFNRLFKCL